MLCADPKERWAIELTMKIDNKRHAGKVSDYLSRHVCLYLSPEQPARRIFQAVSKRNHCVLVYFTEISVCILM